MRTQRRRPSSSSSRRGTSSPDRGKASRSSTQRQLRPWGHPTHQPSPAGNGAAKRQKIETVEPAVSLNMQVFGPLQEGMQSVAESCVYSKGVEMLWKTNLEVLRQKMKSSLQMEHGLFCPIDVDEDATRVTPPDISLLYTAFLTDLNKRRRTFPPQLLTEVPDLKVEMMTPRQLAPPRHKGAWMSFQKMPRSSQCSHGPRSTTRGNSACMQAVGGKWRTLILLNGPSRSNSLLSICKRWRDVPMWSPTCRTRWTRSFSLKDLKAEVDERVENGLRPPIKDIVGLFWADGPGICRR